LKRDHPLYRSNHDEYCCRCDDKDKRYNNFETLMGKSRMQHQDDQDEQNQQCDEEADDESV